MLRSTKSTQRQIRQLELIVTGTGTAALSGPASLQATLVDNGTGDYTITFNQAFAQTPVIMATASTADIVCRIKAVAVGSVNIECKSNAASPAATDAVFHLLIIGSDVQDKF